MNDFGRVSIEEKVDWNLSPSIIIQLSDLLSKSTTYYLEGSIQKAFFTMKALRLRIIQSLNDKERTLVKDLENKFSLNPFDPVNKRKEYVGFINEQYKQYENYTETLMDLLEKYGYLIKKQKDNTSINV